MFVIRAERGWFFWVRILVGEGRIECEVEFVMLFLVILFIVFEIKCYFD